MRICVGAALWFRYQVLLFVLWRDARGVNDVVVLVVIIGDVVSFIGGTFSFIRFRCLMFPPIMFRVLFWFWFIFFVCFDAVFFCGCTVPVSCLVWLVLRIWVQLVVVPAWRYGVV